MEVRETWIDCMGEVRYGWVAESVRQQRRRADMGASRGEALAP